MSELANVVIVMMKCGRLNRGSGIRFELTNAECWVATWAFELTEKSAKKEGYNEGKIGGNIRLGDTYPGCPYCHARAIVKCGSCGKVICWDGETRNFKCSWCGGGGRINGYIKQLNTKIDR